MAEKEYIEREAAIEAIDESLKRVFVLPVGKSIIDKIPAADVRPVVLCRDCKYWEYDAIFADGWCRGKHQGNPNWFCADGEKREES